LYQKYFSNPDVKSSANTVLDQLLNTKIDQFPFQPPPVFKGQLPFTINNILGLLAFTKTQKGISSTIGSYTNLIRSLYNAETITESISNLQAGLSAGGVAGILGVAGTIATFTQQAITNRIFL